MLGVLIGLLVNSTVLRAVSGVGSIMLYAITILLIGSLLSR